MPPPIRFEIRNRIATLTLDRPDRLNALIPEMREGFETALSRAAASLVMGKGLPDDLQDKGLTEADLSPARLRA